MTKRRLIVNTDAKNEADDQFAIVQALLSPSVDVAGIIPAHFGTRRTNRGMEESREEVDLLLRLLGIASRRASWFRGLRLRFAQRLELRRAC